MLETEYFDIGPKVKEGYNRNNYNEKYRATTGVTSFEKKSIDLFLSLLPENATVLDLGCGAANTYDRYIIDQGCNLIGVDFSLSQIERARKNCPQANFYCGDILEYPISEVYDGITLFYSLFHISRERHADLLKRIYDSTAQNCTILLNIRNEDSGGVKMKSDFCDYPMYWSHYSSEVFLKIIRNIGFKYHIIGDEKEFGSSESHLWLILQKG